MGPCTYIVVKHLHTNMRVHLQGDEAAGEFADQLLAIGDGKHPIDTQPDIIQLPENIGTFVQNADELVARVYPNLLSNFRNMSWLSEQCILAPLNETTHAINGILVAQLPGDFVEYRLLDSVLGLGNNCETVIIVPSWSHDNHTVKIF